MKLEKLLITIILVSIFIRLLFLHPSFSDENFYFNAGKNILEGKTPYKDFFFAHPPLQIYGYAFLFKILGTSFFAAKLIPLIISSLTVFLIYKILKEFYDDKTGFIASIIFLVTPAFIAFSTMGYGMWESIFFIFLSIYFIAKNKVREAAIVFVIGILFRYLIAIYLPFLLLLIYIKGRDRKRFLIFFFSTLFLSSLLMLFIFGSNFFIQTVLFHISTKIAVEGLTKLVWQYWSIGFFSVFLALISAFVAHIKKDKLLLLFSIYPLIVDILILLGLNLIIYHYFLISLPFIIMAIAKAFMICDDKLIKVIIPIVLFLSITSNFETIDFYLNPSYAERFYSTAEFIANNTSEDDAIFGEPVMTSYVSFVTGRSISSDYLDSYLRHLMFEGEEKVILKLNEDKPKFFIEMEGYYLSNPYFRDFVLNNYRLEKNIEGIPNYFVYKLK